MNVFPFRYKPCPSCSSKGAGLNVGLLKFMCSRRTPKASSDGLASEIKNKVTSNVNDGFAPLLGTMNSRKVMQRTRPGYAASLNLLSALCNFLSLAGTLLTRAGGLLRFSVLTYMV